MEIERKWLVRSVPAEALAVDGEAIEQGYLALEPGGAEVRLRRRGARCWLTVKRGEGLARDELEVELSPEQFEALWPATDGRRLEKVRRVIPSRSDKLAIELDVYLGRLEGLAVAEVEFASEAAAAAFQAPGWFGDEVTDDPEYRNRRLATAGHDPGAA